MENEKQKLPETALDAAVEVYARKVAYYRSHGGVTKNERKIIKAAVLAALKALGN